MAERDQQERPGEEGAEARENPLFQRGACFAHCPDKERRLLFQPCRKRNRQPESDEEVSHSELFAAVRQPLGPSEPS